MKYNTEVFVRQFPIVKKFAYHLVYFRVLHEAYGEYDLECEFWAHSIDAHLLQAAIYWCMVFGTDGSNEIHWKKLEADKSNELKEHFRKGLPSHVGINASQWKKYWRDMTDFRNKFAAHKDEYTDPVPNFDTALKIVFYYDEWIRKIILPDVFDEPPLTEFVEKLRKVVTPLVNELMRCTRCSQSKAEP